MSRLVKDGHAVRLLVRSPSRIIQAFTPLGLDTSKLEVVQGDVTDQESICKALDGMESVIHIASVYSMDKRRANEINVTNRKGAEIVLNEACRVGLDPIIHVSSITAVLSPEVGEFISPQSPPTPVSIGAYTDSKTAQEIFARHLQSVGYPVVTVYPGAVMGPYDPHWGDGTRLIESILNNKVRLAVEGHVPIVDVRDLARLHSAIMAPGLGPRRFMCSGTSIKISDIVALLGYLTGRKINCTTVPTWMISPIVNLMDKCQGLLPFRLPVTAEGLTILKWGFKFDNSISMGCFGIKKTDLSTTMSDMVEWMHLTGRISAKIAGSLIQ